MKRLSTITLFVCLFITIGRAQIVISEIMYNAPESLTDSLEFIELYNAGDSVINLEGYSFSQGVEFTFPDTMFMPDSFIVVAVDSASMGYTFGITPFQWDSGALSNGGEDIILIDSSGVEIDVVDYAVSSPWPTFAEGANGAGASIEFCLDAEDNSLGENWKPSTTATGDTINAFELKGTPGLPNSADCGNAPTGDVILSGIDFTPADITINIGETVVWRNIDGFHNINGSLETYPDNPEGFGNGSASSDQWEYTYTFNTEGVYNYRCDPHFDLDMVGTVTVINDIPNLVITEIMYNDPSSDDLDSLEFIEVYNAGDSAVHLGGIKLSTNVINFTLPDSILPAGSFLILQKQFSTFINDNGQDFLAIPWQVGGLSNNSDSVALKTEDDDIIDSVVYEDSSPWDSTADGMGYSLSLCSLDADNSDASSWQISSTATNTFVGEDSVRVFADLGTLNACFFSIAVASEVDTNGVAVKSGYDTRLRGVVYGINYRPSGLQFTIIDGDNEGIGVFSASANYGYEVVEGDEVILEGEIGQFNGLTQIYIDTVEFIAADNDLIAADTITALGEMQESSLITIKDVTLVDPSQWTGSGSGFNVDVTNGMDTFQVRIDADVVQLYSGTHPMGTFNLTGIGGQFDSSEPFDSGYQLLPRDTADIDPYVPFVEEFPLHVIGEVTMNNEDGSAASDGLKCELVGVTYGINMRPSGLQFTIIDENNDGIGIFFNEGNLGYDYSEGDLVSIKGSISQFNGLTQISPESITVISNDNVLFDPTEVQQLGEDTESQLTKVSSVTVTDPTEWAGDGSSFNVNVMTAAGESFVMRIDADVELSSMVLPGTALNVTGIGGQFDNEAPFDSGYQLLPRYASDLEMISSTKDPFLSEDLIKVFPNPSSDMISIETNMEYSQIRIYNNVGQLVKYHNGKVQKMNITNYPTGKYLLQFISEEGIVQKEIVKF